MNEKERTSYTAASSLPMKLLRDPVVLDRVRQSNYIPLRHIQLCPTNKCNLNCPFCSCDDVDKKQKWSQDDMEKIIKILDKTDCVAATITGGGEPTLYKSIEPLITSLWSNDIESGLVSNGLTIGNMTDQAISKLTWARFSFSDFRKYDEKFIHTMNEYRKNKNLDMAFSYVVTDKPNLHNIALLMEYANEHDFTHVRFVDDIFNPLACNQYQIKKYLDEKGIDDSIAIYQERKDYTGGNKDCNISLLKPLIAPDGYVYPCCGVQYAQKGTLKTFPEQMRMGHYSELEDILANQKIFDGSSCDKCYYKNYNDFLSAMKTEYNHQRFV